VTIGSQSPLFFVIDALETLRPGEQRRPFAPWINIYDRNDLLSYLAGRVFAGIKETGIKEICDIEICAGVPFPEAHSAYFYQDETYSLLRDRWPTEA
jgi:hypothetical protein